MRANASRNVRIAQNVSSAPAELSPMPITWATRSAACSPRRSAATTSAILRLASAGGSLSARPAASVTTSTIGQNVIPSPYGRHRPRSATARSPVVVEELLDQARLADAGRAQDREELALPPGDRPFERLPQQRGLALPVDER